MQYYDQQTELLGAVKDLAVKKLNASPEDKIEFAEYTWDSGFCETCSYTEYDFHVLKNGEVVYDSKGHYYTGLSPFGDFQNWLTEDDESEEDEDDEE